MCKLEVKIDEKEKTYPIFINNEDIENVYSSVLNQIDNKNYIVVISKKVYELYGDILGFPREKIFVLKDGEEQKNLENYTKIMKFAFKNQLHREDAVIAVGGGVVGDLAGFAASTYMRGIKYIQIPTTLLAATDSSVGGKTAINSKFGKNTVGTFYQPNAVFINVNFLKTLDDKQYKSGLGEVVKYAFIEKSCMCDEDLHLMNFLSENYEKILKRDILTLREMIEMCLKLKISVVNKDEKESGLRQILNFGHTFGHAVEKVTNYRKYTHGQCVVHGMESATNAAFHLGKIDKEYKFLCQDLIKKFDFVQVQKYPQSKILDAMSADKKVSGGKIKLVLPVDYARVEVFEYSPEELKEVL